MTTKELLNSIGERKTVFTVTKPVSSFSVSTDENSLYVEPTLKPVAGTLSVDTKVVMITAAGATGKSAMAKYLSAEKQLPILDLALHKAVGEDSFDGLLVSTYGYAVAGEVMSALNSGKYAVVIEAVDEGRLKTSEEALNAFFGNIAEIAGRSTGISFVLLGRFQSLESLWLNFTEQEIDTVLLEIQVFDKEQAKQFVDLQVFSYASTRSAIIQRQKEYEEVRDFIIASLDVFFSSSDTKLEKLNEKFVGYAPVLLAIAELLRKEQNYHKLLSDLSSQNYHEKEIDLVVNILQRILERERSDKVVEKYIPSLGKWMTPVSEKLAVEKAYSHEEQCLRLVEYITSRSSYFPLFDDDELQIAYESGIEVWLKDHPFLQNGEFQNAIFESYCLCVLLSEAGNKYHDKALQYLTRAKYKSNQLFIILFDRLNTSRSVHRELIPFLYGSAKSMDSKDVYTEFTVESIDPDDIEDEQRVSPATIEIYTSLGGRETLLEFESLLKLDSAIAIGGYVRDIFMTVPCDVQLFSGGTELKIGPNVMIRARNININCSEISSGDRTIERVQEKDAETVILDCEQLNSSVTRVHGALKLAITCQNVLTHPLVSFRKDRKSEIEMTPQLQFRYRRFKRIVLALRSHSKGSLARFHAKIEHRRLLKNEEGRKVLDRMVRDRILVLRGDFYHWGPELASSLVGVTWEALRRGEQTDLLLKYLSQI